MFPAAFVEEGFKFLVFYFIVLKLKDFDEPMDALVYGVTVSLGFATLENIYYVYFSDFSIIYGSTLLASIRAISAIPAHAAFGCLMGYFMLKYHFQKSTLDILLAFLIPSIIHFVYNFSMFFGSLIIVIAIVLALILTNIFILKKIKVQQLKG
jgi:RsiW-degrading membrane proteinase PrsW (M82 family)